MLRQIVKSAILMAAFVFLSTGKAVLAQVANPQAVNMYNLGLTAYKQGSPESAVIFFKRACDIDPNLADAQYNLGMIYQSEKRFKDAIPRFLEVLRIKPVDPDAHFQLGIIYQETGQLTEAKQHFSAIAPNNPHFPDAQSHLAQINNQSNGGGVVAPTNTINYNAPAANPDEQGVNDPTRLPFNPQMTQNTQSSQDKLIEETNPAFLNQETQAQKAVSKPAVHTPVAIAANTSLHTIATGFNAPSGITFDRNGHLYIANFASNTIERINADGSRAPFVSGASLKGPIGLVADDNGNLYVANYLSGNISRISAAGIATTIATGFHKPYYLTLDHEGNLYVSQQEDNSIIKISLPHPVASKP